MATTVERLQVEVSAQTAAARAELARMDASTRRTTSSGTKSMARLARGMGLAFGGAAVVGGITKTIGLAMEFDKTMRTVAVQTGESGKGLEDLSNLAKDMGQQTIYSAQDAGQAMLNLAKGGLTSAQIKAGALKESLRLAAAGGIDLDSAAGIMANSMTMFGLKAANAGQVTTALAGAANASTASVDSLRMALGQVGSGARQSGLSIQETVAALAEFDQAGVKGSDAGTSLKTMLQRLVPMTEKSATAMKRLGLNFSDAHGNFLPLDKIAQQLQDHLGNLSQVQRTQALNTIFGSDASRAAAILMRGGAAEVQKYTKAAKDQATTQKMANAAMEGASGAWENFKGTVETLAITVGQQALPLVTKLLNQGNELLNSANQWGPGVAADFEGVAHAIEATVHVIEPLASMLKSVATGFQSLPGPVKSTAIEVGLAALIWPRLSRAAVGALTPIGTGLTTASTKLKQFRSEMTYSATRAQAMGGALRSVAGPAGLGLLVAGAQSGNDAVKTLSTVGGAALMGFAAGGPIGGAIAGGGALLGELVSHMKAAGEQAKHSRADYGGLIDTLDSVTGATTAATRAFILDQLQRAETTTTLAKYGITARTAVDAVLGQARAVKVVNAALKGQQTYYTSLTGQIHKLQTAEQQANAVAAARLGPASAAADKRAQAISDHIAALRKERDAVGASMAAVRQGIPAVNASIAAKRREIRATQDLTGKLHGLPKRVTTLVEQKGVPVTVKGLAHLAAKYHLVPKQIKTLITAAGLPVAVKNVERVKAKLKEVNKTKVDLSAYQQSLRAGSHSAEATSREMGLAVLHKAEEGPKKAKANLSGYIESVRAGSVAAQGVASTGGHAVGAALSEGVIGGFAGTGAVLAHQAAAAVNQAVAAARAAADAHSPSRKMQKLGHDLAKGAEKGMKERRRKLRESGRQMIQSVMSGIKESQGAALRTLKQLGQWAAKHFSGKQEHAWAQRVRAATRRVREDYERLKNVTDKLAKAQAHLSDLRGRRQEFMSNISGGITAQASVTNAGADAGSIATNLATQAAKVKEFAAMLVQLRKRGWADQIIRDIAAAGVEGGYDTAKALLSASAEQEASINQSYKAIYDTARQTAKTMGDAMYGAGIRAAQGAVAGLRRRQRGIKEALITIAEHMADAIRRAIGIRTHHHRAGSGSGGAGARRIAGGGSGAGSGASGTPFRRRDTVATRTMDRGGVIHFHFKTYYPRSETQSVTVNRTLARVAALNLV